MFEIFFRGEEFMLESKSLEHNRKCRKKESITTLE